MKELKTRDRKQESKKWSPTELLIIALISHGFVPTLYALQKETLLSPGALVPALAKLKEKGLLVEVGEPGPRNRLQLRVPQAVLKKIDDEWRSTAPDYIENCDAVLKLCKAAEIVDMQEAVKYANEAIELRVEKLRKYRNKAGEIVAPKPDYRSYLSYREVAEFYRLQAEEQTLRAILGALKTDE